MAAFFPANPDNVTERDAQKLVCPDPETKSNDNAVLLMATFFTALNVPVGSPIGTEKSLPTRAEYTLLKVIDPI